jgi:V/A-type H+-transporting ATPase subunit D
MTQLKLNKASLSLEQRNLKNYQKYLPSLELKRKKLLSEQSIVDRQIKSIKEKETEISTGIENNLPMASEYLDLVKQLMQIKAINIGEENIVGVKLPVFDSVQFSLSEYSYFNTPQWFELLIESVSQLIETRLQLRVLHSRSQILSKALQTVTQRKNLFEKVLIPKALGNIRLIRIFLSDSERAAVVTSKIAKKKRQLS